MDEVSMVKACAEYKNTTNLGTESSIVFKLIPKTRRYGTFKNLSACRQSDSIGSRPG
jgi:hypothetical protein